MSALSRLSLPQLEVIGAATAVVVVSTVAYITQPWVALRGLDVRYLLSACGLYGASLILTSGIWVYVLRRSDSTVSLIGGLGVSVSSLIGVLTPLNLGTDLLRSLYGKRRLGVKYESTAAATAITRILKAYSSLLVLVVLVALAPIIPRQLTVPLAGGLAGGVLLVVALHSVRTRYVGQLARRLAVGEIGQALRDVDGSLGRTHKTVICAGYAAGFALDWITLHLCFLALRLAPTVAETFVVFAVLFCLSRAPILPQGAGVVEAGGFAALKVTDLGTNQAGALLVLWHAMRVLVPVILAVGWPWGRRRVDGTQRVSAHHSSTS